LVELVPGKAGSHEVPVVHEDVLDPGIDQVGGQVRFPDSFREPESPGLNAKPASEGLLHPEHLLDTVCPKEGWEDRLVIPSQEKLELSISSQPTHHVQVTGLVGLHPIEEGSGQMQREGKEVPLNGTLEKGRVDIPKVLFENVSEVAHRLMGVKPEGEGHRVLHGVAHVAEVKPRISRRTESCWAA
jgi:hypothetical protein